MVFDRLSVLVIRIYVHRARRELTARRPRPATRRACRCCTEQLVLLQEALEALFDDVRDRSQALRAVSEPQAVRLGPRVACSR